MKSIVYALIIIMSYSLQAQNQSCNCCTKQYQEFDFWVGEWTVTQPNGDHAGHNTLVKVEGNCVLKENWTSAKGDYTGTSYSFYNAQKNNGNNFG